MYEYKRKTSRKSIFVTVFLFIIIFLVLGFILYNMFYINPENMNTKNYETVRLSGSESLNEENSQNPDISNILEKNIKSVVGISKMKDVGNSVFLNNSTRELGLGSGIIVTSNRIYCN